MALDRIRTRIGHIRSVASMLTEDARGRRNVLIHGARLFLSDQLGLRGRPRTLELWKEHARFAFTTDSVADISLLHDVFVREEYGLVRELPAPAVVVDLGSNVGISLLFFRTLFPDASLYGFEPDPRSFQTLEGNIASLGNVRVSNVAVGAEDGERDFFSDPTRGASSSLIRRKPSQVKGRARVVSLDTLLEERPEVDLLKFDIEGAEYAVFAASRSRWRVPAFIGEVHTDLTGHSLEEFCGLFAGYDVHTLDLAADRHLFFARRTSR
jgi:FkbM family methyltransferase